MTAHGKSELPLQSWRGLAGGSGGHPRATSPAAVLFVKRLQLAEGGFIPIQADVGREEVAKSCLEDGQQSVCPCGRSGDPMSHAARGGEGSPRCPAWGLASGHLDVRGEVCVPWVWHLQGFFPGRADLRKSPQMYVLSGAGSREASLPKTPRCARSVASANPPPFCGSREGDFSGEGLAPALLEMREV